jgi:hypothetical protein
MVGASKGYEQVVASCCQRIRKRPAGSPPEGPPKKDSFPKRIFSEHIEGFPTSLPKIFGASRHFLKNSDAQIHRIFGMFRDLIIFTTGERGRIFFSKNTWSIFK